MPEAVKVKEESSNEKLFCLGNFVFLSVEQAGTGGMWLHPVTQ